jgi:hypothetical protein
MKIKFKKPFSIAGLITATVLAVLLILFIGAYSKREAFSSIDIFGGKETIIESQNKDTDSDGLKDWQEDLFRTDPANPDTDGDGFLDGEEINSSHNPLIKSPGDTQVFHPLPLGDKYNLTKKVLSDENLDTLFTSYLEQKAEYVNNNTQLAASQEDFTANVGATTISEMWKRALGDLYSVLTEQAMAEIEKIPDVFNITVIDSDINISQENNKEAIQNYINQVSDILYANNFFLKEEASNAIMKAFEEDDFSQLDVLIKENDDRIERAKEISVPSTWKEIHKEGLELTLLIRNIYVALRDVYDDPLKAYIANEELENFSLTWNDLMAEAIDLASSQGIALSLQK